MKLKVRFCWPKNGRFMAWSPMLRRKTRLSCVLFLVTSAFAKEGTYHCDLTLHIKCHIINSNFNLRNHSKLKIEEPVDRDTWRSQGIVSARQRTSREIFWTRAGVPNSNHAALNFVLRAYSHPVSTRCTSSKSSAISELDLGTYPETCKNHIWFWGVSRLESLTTDHNRVPRSSQPCVGTNKPTHWPTRPEHQKTHDGALGSTRKFLTRSKAAVSQLNMQEAAIWNDAPWVKPRLMLRNMSRASPMARERKFLFQFSNQL